MLRTSEQKRFELAVMAEELGGLPMDIDRIIALEAAGAVVDLVTGVIIGKGSEQRVSLTAIGEAVAVANEAWERG